MSFQPSPDKVYTDTNGDKYVKFPRDEENWKIANVKYYLPKCNNCQEYFSSNPKDHHFTTIYDHREPIRVELHVNRDKLNYILGNNPICNSCHNSRERYKLLCDKLEEYVGTKKRLMRSEINHKKELIERRKKELADLKYDLTRLECDLWVDRILEEMRDTDELGKESFDRVLQYVDGLPYGNRLREEIYEYIEYRSQKDNLMVVD